MELYREGKHLISLPRKLNEIEDATNNDLKGLLLHFQTFVVISIYDGVRRASGLCWEPVVSVKNPTMIPISH